MPRIQVEDKHTYNSVNTALFGCRRDSFIASHNNDSANSRYIITYLEPTYPVTGTDESNRIGRKIYSSSLCSEGFIKLFNTIDNDNINTIYDVYTFHNSDELTALNGQVTPQQAPFNTNEQALDLSIRHMFVEFDDICTDADFNTYFFDWFVRTYIQTGLDQLPSNRTQMLRESTMYTGSFNILWDKVHHLSLRNPVVHYKEVIPYKRTMNFDGTGSGAPTGKKIYELFIGPTNLEIDYGSYSLGRWISNNAADLTPNIYVADLSTTLKFKYTDM